VVYGLAPTTVTIIPTSKKISNTYPFSAVTGTPDATSQQVSARTVSATTPAQTKKVSASGHLSVSATQAKGMLYLRNWDHSASRTFEAGTVFPYLNGDRVIICPDTAGTEMVLDATVTVPPLGPSGRPTPVEAPAHVLQFGADGNIVLNGEEPSFCYSYLWTDGFCSPGWLGYCFTIEPATHFTGGRDAYDGPMVQQSDIDAAANSLISKNQPDPQQVLRSALKSDERPAGSPQCAAHVTSDHQAGDEAAQVAVSVTFACTGEAYDYGGAAAMAAQLLMQQAKTDPGAGYALVGKVKATVINATVESQGAITFTISAAGVWAYQFSNAQKQALTRLIVGKSVQAAQRLLAAQTGTAQVAIDIPAGGQTVPSDTSRIIIKIQMPPGA
jgi:VCBS repeat-containing protein